MRGVVTRAIASGVIFGGIWVTISAGEDSAITQADRAFVQAVATADRPALAKFLDADFTWTDSEGRTRTRAQALRDLPNRAISNERDAQLKQYVYGALGDVQVNLGRAHVLRVWAKRPEGWKVIVYQEVISLDAPPSFAPARVRIVKTRAGGFPISLRMKLSGKSSLLTRRLETAAMAHNSSVFATLVAAEFVATSSNSNKLYDKRGRMDDFDHAKMAGVAPTPLSSAHMFDFGDAVLMRSEHTPDRGKPLHVTRVWVKRDGGWMETLSYQTSVKAAN